MIGGIAGDIIGSVYEGHNIKRTDFPLFGPWKHFTDDTVFTVAVADVILLNGNYIAGAFSYDLDRTVEHIRPTYRFDVSCQGSVPEAIIAFLESTDFESAVRFAVSLGGDSDTIACMTGGMAEAYYGGVPEEISSQVLKMLDDRQKSIVNMFIE